MKYVILIYGDTKAKIMFFMLFFTYSRYFKKKEGVSCTFDTPSSCRLWDHLKTNYMQLIAAYMQLVTPSEVAMAVRMLMAI